MLFGCRSKKEKIFENRYDPDHPLPRGITRDPGLAVYVDGWGRPGDLCLVADDDGEVVGAAWARLFTGEDRGYGTVDSHTPELCIAVSPAHRGRGVGEELLRRLLTLLAERGHVRASLSVQKANPALHLYQRLGFSVLQDRGDEYVMTSDP